MQIKEEFLELLKIFKQKDPKYILEIGRARGGNLFCFCKSVKENAILISIDLPGSFFGQEYPEWEIPIYQAFAKNLKNFIFKDFKEKILTNYRGTSYFRRS